MVSDGNKTVVIYDLLKSIYKNDIMENAGSFSNRLSNAQVVKFFERQGVSFTKTMIQNYIRVGLIPPPDDSRFYSKDHLYMLALIAHLKNVYSIDELRELFHLVMDDDLSFESAGVAMKDAYDFFMEAYDSVFNELSETADDLGEDAAEAPVLEDNRENTARFAAALSFMVRSFIYKQLAVALIQA